jgi:putative endonuclease
LGVDARRKTWYVYILRCADGTFYTGITNDVKKRTAAHNKGKGAKYTRGRGPAELVYKKRCRDKTGALKKEFKIKQLSKARKLKIIREQRSGRGSAAGNGKKQPKEK